jgi:hypothetical protein
MQPSPRIASFAQNLAAVARRWHRYEIRGAEHIPTDRASLLVMYHGFMPFDAGSRPVCAQVRCRLR